MLTIGFASKFYTLWDVTNETVYVTDAYGNHHASHIVTRYSYMQNISTSLKAAKAKYPEAPVCDDLRGKTASWERASTEDLTPELLKFGKYRGYTIQEVSAKDFQYILWLVDNARPATKEACMNLPEVVAHFAEIARQEAEAMASHPIIESGVNEVVFLCNPNHTIRESYPLPELPSELSDKYYAVATAGEGSQIVVVFDDVHYVNGMYPYNMAIIGGKAKKIKNKSLTLNLEVLLTDNNVRGAFQVAVIR